MKTLLSTLIGVALATTATSGFAADDMKHGSGMGMGMGMGMDMKMMDTNHDGMISKEEFMRHHEAMWAKMKKNKNGMVDMKDMEKMHGDMMKGDMMKGDMMKGDNMKDSMKK